MLIQTYALDNVVKEPNILNTFEYQQNFTLENVEIVRNPA